LSTWATVKSLGLALPGAEESTSYGTPAIKVKGKLMVRLLESGVDVAVRAGMEERAALVSGAPDVFEVTPHYESYPWVVVHLAAIDRGLLKDVLAEAWQMVAPKSLLAPAPKTTAKTKRRR
jgi:hypothetical protein